MEEEAGQKAEKWSDDDGNRYGALMNELEEKIEKAEKRIKEITDKLDK